MFKVAIVGNQNVGKTTLFNLLTGSSQHIGNFPGTTVSTVEGVWLQNHEVILVDLPGIYSLTPFTQEEQIAYYYLTHQKIDLLLNIIDATVCTRSLYLTLQCLDLEYPMIVAVNKMEELKQAQGNLDCQQLALRLNVPCMEINTLTGQGILECMQKGITLQQHAIHLDFYSSNIQYLITQLQQQLSCSFFDCIQYFETGFFPYQLSKKQTLQVENIIQHQKLDSIIAENRYLFIQQLLKDIYQSPKFDLQYRLSQQIDHWILSKYFGFPILSLFFSLVFFLTFGILGPFFNQLLSHLFNSFVSIFTLIFQPLIHPILFSLVVHGIFRGSLSVLNFLPLILLLFFFLSLLEDSGYMARVALLLDSLLKKIGLTGKSFVPLLLGLGCTVPAVLSTRILKDKQEKN